MVRRLMMNIPKHLFPIIGNGRRNILLLTVLLLSFSFSMQLPSVLAAPESFIVNDASDALNGDCNTACTLRDAIELANNNGNPADTDSITFAIGSGPVTIILGSDLPAITEAVFIDGSTQGGATCDSPAITIDGGAAATGIHLDTGSNNSTVQWLGITGTATSAILIESTDNLIQCTLLTGNTGTGVSVATGAGNTINSNRIYTNGGAGIDLAGGANDDQAAPVFTTVSSDGSTTSIIGTVAGTTGDTVEIFSCTVGNSEGENLLGTAFVDGSSTGFDISIGALQTTDAVSATITNANGSTSEFSTCQAVAGAPQYISNPTAGAVPISAVENTPQTTNINISNPGLGDLVLDPIEIDLAGDPEITLVSTAPITINPGNDTDLQVQCNSAVTGTFTSTLTVTHNAAGGSAVYDLTCDVTAAPAPEFTSNPAPGDTIDFGQVAVSSTSSFNIQISNSGTAPFDITNIALSGDNPGDFVIAADDLLPKTLPGGTSDTITISCEPQSVDPNLDAALTFDTTDTNNLTVTYNLLCEGVPTPAQYGSSVAVGSTINVGSSPVGTPVTNATAFTITNPGGSDLTVSFAVSGGNAANFDVPAGSIVVPATTGSYDVSITCTPDAAGLRTTTLTVSHDAPAGSTATYTLNCTGEAPVYTSAPVDGSTIDMGSTPVGTPITADVLTITNTGTAPLDVSFGVSTGDASNFTVNTGASTVAANGGTLDVSVTCDPDIGALRTTMLTVNHDAPIGSTATYTLNCTGTAPGYSSTPAAGGTINVGTTNVGVLTTNTTALVITNTGSGPLNVSFSHAGGDAGDFTINTGASTVVAGGGTLDVSISCTPSAPGPRTSTLTVNHDAPAGSSVTYTLNCTGTAPVFASNPAAGGTINIGTSQVGTPVTNAAALQISNNGDAPMTISFGLVGADSAEFIVNTANGTTVNPGTPVNVSITCTPTEAAGRTTTLEVTHNDPVTTSPVTYTVNCTGIAAGTPIYDSAPLNGQTLNVGSTTVGTPITNLAALVITNSGTAPLTLAFDLSGGDAGDFTFNTADQTLGSGASLDVSISCNPSAAAVRTTTLTINHNATGSPASYPVICTGTAPIAPIYTSNPAPGNLLTIGSAVVGSPVTNANALTITNTGTGTLNVSFASDNTDYVVNTPAQAINAGASLIVSITCTPTAAGARGGNLTVTHDAAGSPATYPFDCTGTNPPTGAVYTSNPTDGTALPIGSAIVGSPVTNMTALTITNTGTAPLNVSFTSSSAEYVINTPAQAINAGGSLVVSITCTPTALGARGGDLTVTHDAAGSPATYPFDCTGITPPTGPGYSSVPAAGGTISITTSPGTAATRTVTISESGDQPLTINSYALTGSAAAMTVLSVTGPTAPFTINDGEGSQILTVRCLSNTTGVFTGSLNVTHNAIGGTASYNVSCNVSSGTPDYDSDPVPGSTINLGTVQIGTAISVNLRVFNRGTGNLAVTLPAGNILISGPNAADFAVITNPPPFSVNPGNSIDVTIRCIPTITGLEVATLTFRTNDPGQPTVSYALNCIGSGTPVSTVTPVGFIATATPFVPTPTPVLPATGTVSNEVKGLAMRTGPYLGATLVGGIRPGAPFSILARSNDESPQFTWYLIADANGVTGWVSGRYLQVTGNIDAVPFQGSVFDTLDNVPDIGVTARAMSIIDIRRRPSGRTTILGQIPQDATISIIGRTRQNGGDFWVQIRYNGIVGWIPAAPIDVHGSTANVPIR